ncbi:MAG: hypothetical protein M3439_13230 [Chloroflexota bacterium]|nr:hypothetical protein [Chloroflexota bacterium]
MERWSKHVLRDGTPRSLRETPLLVLGGVAIFVIWAVVFATILLDDDEPGAVAGVAADQPTATATATASSTPSESRPIATGTTQLATIPPAAVTSAVTPPPPTAETVASEATVAPAPSTPSEPQATTQATQSNGAVLAVLVELLPTLEDLPDGFVVTNEGSLALDELAAIHPDPETQRERLRDWGFTGAIERQFEIEDGSDTTEVGMTLVTALVVEFRTPDDARAAVEASHADAQAAEDADISNVEIEPLGDFARAASGTLMINGEPLHVAYVIVQLGNRAISFAGGSPAQNPISEVVEVVNRTLN